MVIVTLKLQKAHKSNIKVVYTTCALYYDSFVWEREWHLSHFFTEALLLCHLSPFTIAPHFKNHWFTESSFLKVDASGINTCARKHKYVSFESADGLNLQIKTDKQNAKKIIVMHTAKLLYFYSVFKRISLLRTV